jgi:aminopeptidase-like protein
VCSSDLVAVCLAENLLRVRHKYSYRFLFLPGTIGSIAWLAKNETLLHRIKHGLVLACVGDSGTSTYKKSRKGNADIDRAVIHVLKQSGSACAVQEFVPYGYDERQYCSPAFDLPVGCLMRTPHGQYPEYHTSADNLDFVRASSLMDTLSKCLEVFELLESNRTFVNQYPKCEPQLGKRGLYRSVGGQRSIQDEQAMFWVLNLSDGGHSLLDIAERSDIRYSIIKKAAELLLEYGLLQPSPALPKRG